MNPLDSELFGYGADVDWYRGLYVLQNKATRFYQNNPWIPVTIREADQIIATHQEEAWSVLCAVMSWRSVTVGQLRAGLANTPVPLFDWLAPSLWGALLRKGWIDCGFPLSLRMEGTPPGDVWIRASQKQKNVRDWLQAVHQPSWMLRVIADSGEVPQHAFARHNTFADHCGLVAVHDPRCVYTAGDGWCAFTALDPQATRLAAISRGAAGDVSWVTGDGVTVVGEVQSSTHEVVEKFRRWIRFLHASPFTRRGLICLWILIPSSAGTYPSFASIVSQLSVDPLVMTGVPSVGSRCGIVRWDTWFTSEGYPTDRWGSYTDLCGVQRTVWDTCFVSQAPVLADPVGVVQWGCPVVRDVIKSVWGWDTSTWGCPSSLCGGWNGFTRCAGYASLLSTESGVK